MRTKRFLAAIAALGTALGVSVAFSSPASADTSGSPVSYSAATSHVSDVVMAVASSDVKGKIDLEYQVKTGYKTSARCVKITKWSQRAGHRCIIVTARMRGDRFANSGVTRAGHRYYFTDYVGSKYTPVRSKFYFDRKHHTWRKSNCGNFVRFTKLPKRKVSEIALVKSFSSVKVTLKVTATASVTATAKASCSTATSSASATASAKGTGSAFVYVTASARTAVRAKAKGLSSVKTKVRNQAVANAMAVAAADATASAEAQATCTNTPPTCPPGQTGTYPNCTPPATAPTVSITTINDVDQGGTSPNFCATVNVPGSDTGTLTFTAHYGSFTTSTFTVNGMNKYCTTYVAFSDPTTTTTVQETVTATVRDNTTGLSAVQSEMFPVNPPAVHP